MAKVVKSRSQTSSARHYPKPGPVGGRLIRELIAHFREHNVELPLDEHHATVLLGCSAGSDSVALAHLIARYGRKIVSNPRKIRLLHVNHGWRGEESAANAQFVRNLARALKVGFSLKACRPPVGQGSEAGKSWEDIARAQRKQFYESEARKRDGIVLTAHQADDVAETMLWRILTGQADTHGGGILFHHGVELRPLLRIRKKDLKAYLREEGQEWREDSTNFSSRFMRSRVRQELMPIVEHIFPKAVQHLCELARKAAQVTELQQAQAVAQGRAEDLEKLSVAEDEFTENPILSLLASSASSALFGTSGVALRRPHWNFLQEKLAHEPQWTGQLSLPGGWRLTRVAPRTRLARKSVLGPPEQKPNVPDAPRGLTRRSPDRSTSSESEGAHEKWILEKG